MNLVRFDHIVLCVSDVERTLRFYEELLGMERREERPGKWALHFGNQKISLQSISSLPEIARRTVPGSGNFCLLAEDPVEELADHLHSRQVEILAGPDDRIGAVGMLRSIYFRDPDGNLVEVSNAL